MLSPKAEKKLQRLAELIGQVEEIHREIEKLLIPVSEQDSESPTEQPAPKRREWKPKHATLADVKPGFKSTSDWYQLKARYKKQYKQSADLDNAPDFDTADDEEPEDEPIVQKTPADFPAALKRYDYQCSCGYSFKSTIPPQLIKCPDCMGKPRLVEELKQED
jgi:hypothetical protein